MPFTRRQWLSSIPSIVGAAVGVRAALARGISLAAASRLSTVIGTGAPGLSDADVNNPYGVVLRGGELFFCDLDNQRVRAVSLRTRATRVVAGNGEKGHAGDGGPALAASLNMPHEIQFDAQGHMYIAERDSHVVRRVDAHTQVMTTIAGTGVPGFSGDGGPAGDAQLRQPHSLVIDAQQRLFVCDIGNHRIRRIDLATGLIDTFAGTGVAAPTPDGAPRVGTPLRGPRTFALGADGTMYLALREGNAVLRLDAASDTWRHVAGVGTQGYTGDGGPATLAQLGGPKGLAVDDARGALYLADTENHVIRRIDLRSGLMATVIGTGQRGDGPGDDPLQCRMARPHGLYVDGASGTLYVTDSEAHRIRALTIA